MPKSGLSQKMINEKWKWVEYRWKWGTDGGRASWATDPCTDRSRFPDRTSANQQTTWRSGTESGTPLKVHCSSLGTYYMLKSDCWGSREKGKRETSSVLAGHVGKTPDVAESDGVAGDRRGWTPRCCPIWPSPQPSLLQHPLTPRLQHLLFRNWRMKFARLIQSTARNRSSRAPINVHSQTSPMICFTSCKFWSVAILAIHVKHFLQFWVQILGIFYI